MNRLPLTIFLESSTNDRRTFASAEGVFLSVVVCAVTDKPADGNLGFPPFNELGIHLTDLDGFGGDNSNNFKGDNVRVTDQIREVHVLTFRCLTS